MTPTREQIAAKQLSNAEKLYKRWRAKQEDTYVYGTVVPPRELVSWVRDFAIYFADDALLREYEIRVKEEKNG